MLLQTIIKQLVPLNGSCHWQTIEIKAGTLDWSTIGNCRLQSRNGPEGGASVSQHQVDQPDTPR